jgi:hypothetical protein
MLLTLLGTALLFLGERTFGEGSTRLVLSGTGALLVLGALVSRKRSASQLESDAQPALSSSLRFSGLFLLSLIVYACTTETALETLSLTEDGEHRYLGVLGVLWPILALAGLLPMALIDRAIQATPLAVPPARLRQAVDTGLSIAFAIALVFPLNYLGTELNKRWDLTYFRTTDAGTSTHALVNNLTQPVTAVLFFSSASEVAREVRPYFEALEGEHFKVEWEDHAFAPQRAEALKVRKNGTIAFVVGEGDDQKTETIKVGTDIDKAKRKLEKLDTEVQKALLKIAKGKRNAYFVVGHGEMHWQSKDGPLTKISNLKKLLEMMNFKVDELGIGEGLTDTVPEDATIVFVLGPTADLLPEETAALNAYRERGGRLFIALEPGQEGDFSGLVEPMGISFNDETLATDDKYVLQTRGLTDRVNLVTNRYSSHPTVTTLSKSSAQAWMITPGAGSLEELKGKGGKVTVTVRSLPKTWSDVDGNYKFDEASEARKVYKLAAVAEGPSTTESEYRAVVVADATFLSDGAIPNKANAQFVLDATHWLAGEEELAGTVNTEEDVKIQHTREGQKAWFFGTSFLFPVLIFGFGLLRLRNRRPEDTSPSEGGEA